MVIRLAALALALGAASLAPAAHASEGTALTLQVWAGASRYDVAGLEAGIANQGEDLLQARASTFGGSAVLRLGALDLGLLYEGQVIQGETDSAVLTPVVGLALPLGELLRLDLLGELGGHRVSGVQFDGQVDVSQAESVWLPYVGVRPTLVVRLPVGPLHLVVSAAAFARWDLVKKDASLTVTESGGASTVVPYELGGTTFGLAVGAGVEL